MFRLSRPIFFAALLSSCAASALALDRPLPLPLSVAAAPSRLPAVPPLAAEDAASLDDAGEDIAAEDVPAPVTMASVTPSERPQALVEDFLPSAHVAFDPETYVPETVGEFSAPAPALAAAKEAPEVRVAQDTPEGNGSFDDVASVPASAPVVFDERRSTTRGGFAFAQLDFGLAPLAAASPSRTPPAQAPAQSFEAAMAALASPAPEAEPQPADGAPLTLAMAGAHEAAPGPASNVAPRRRPKVPARETAEGGPEVPLVFELRRSAH
jgi:hypothetical protein